MGLSGRRALVTGAGRGIGRLVALRLADVGCDVALSSRTLPELEAVAKEVRARGRNAEAIVADVSRPEDVSRMFGSAREALGPIEILVNGAGVAPSAPFAKTTETLWRQAIETNLSGVFYAIREALPEMIAGGWGRIVNIASIAGKTGYPYIAAYAASKHGVLGLTKCAALEAAPYGVTVNAVCPGYVDTPMTDASVRRIVEKTGKPEGAVRKALEDMSPQKRLFTVDEVASLVLYLCGDDARGITGQALSLDGGTVV
jgi:NAD(P)-dependent dehydrogenase (short-subunit alcohol dehydrogenase family)